VEIHLLKKLKVTLVAVVAIISVFGLGNATTYASVPSDSDWQYAYNTIAGVWSSPYNGFGNIEITKPANIVSLELDDQNTDYRHNKFLKVWVVADDGQEYYMHVGCFRFKEGLVACADVIIIGGKTWYPDGNHYAYVYKNTGYSSRD
jgi:hypothetical protein